ncbi:MAG: LysM peptidoglycan-binding domain-containing protein [Limisphaerales bacterium]
MMKCRVSLLHWAVLVWLSVLIAGCGPAAQNASDEEREAHYLAGKARVSSLDYPGAVESFEKALVVNPQSAAAHFELGCLFEAEISDPAEAIYHFQKYLKLRPRAGNAEIIRQRILNCKQELAKSVFLGAISQKQQRDYNTLEQENTRIKEENARLKSEFAALSAPVKSSTAPAPRNATLPAAVVAEEPRRPTDNAAPALAARRTHTVIAGETPILIARHYGVKLEALMAANPRLDARRMRVGEAIAIPAR